MTWPVRHQDDEITQAIADGVRSIAWFLNVVMLGTLGAFMAVVNGFAMMLFWTWDRGMDASGRKHDVEHGVKYSLLFVDDTIWIPFNMHVHQLTMSDENHVSEKSRDRFSIVLSGCYMEQALDLETGHTEREWKGPWSWGYSPADRPTRTELSSIETDPECWILSVDLSGPKEWGYYKDNDPSKWISSEELDYEDDDDDNEDVKDENDTSCGNDDTANGDEKPQEVSELEQQATSSIWFLGGKSSTPVKQD